MQTFAFLAVVSAALVSAQTAQQYASAAALAAQVPACVLPCDDAAITSVGCGLTDYSCHCAHGAQLSQIIPACIKANATSCTPADLTLFASLPPKICAALNSTAPASNGTSSNGTSTTVSAGYTASSNATVTSTATVGGSTGNSSAGTTYVTATGSGSATAKPTGPSSASSASSSPAGSTNGASLHEAASGLFAAVGAGLFYLAL